MISVVRCVSNSCKPVIGYAKYAKRPKRLFIPVWLSK
jgi:hypothetical protein